MMPRIGYVPTVLLSVIIPVWQDARRVDRLAAGVAELRAALPYPVEAIVVDDGSTDRTGDLAEAAGLRVIRQAHRGRGAAVRAGMLAATGVYRLLADADWSMPPTQALTMLPPVVTGFDVAIGSRYIHGAQRHNENVVRFAASRTYNRIVQGFLLPGIIDTQCGFKCFRAEAARALFSRTREDGSAMDVEVLALGRSLGLKIIEVPIDWHCDGGGRMRSLRDAPGMVTALARIRARLAAGTYPPLDTEPIELFEDHHMSA